MAESFFKMPFTLALRILDENKEVVKTHQVPIPTEGCIVIRREEVIPMSKMFEIRGGKYRDTTLRGPLGSTLMATVPLTPTMKLAVIRLKHGSYQLVADAQTKQLKVYSTMYLFE